MKKITITRTELSLLLLALGTASATAARFLLYLANDGEGSGFQFFLQYFLHTNASWFYDPVICAGILFMMSFGLMILSLLTFLSLFSFLIKS